MVPPWVHLALVAADVIIVAILHAAGDILRFNVVGCALSCVGSRSVIAWSASVKVVPSWVHLAHITTDVMVLAFVHATVSIHRGMVART